MSSLNEAPSGERLHIAVFGRRNAGKSSLVNALSNQALAIVSDVPGTTTDPVSKAMELLPLGPVSLIDTAGLDDVGELGALRVGRTWRVLERTDVALLVVEATSAAGEFEEELVRRVHVRSIPLVVVVNKRDLGGDLVSWRRWAGERSLPIVEAAARNGDNIAAVKQTLIDAVHRPSADPSIVGDLLQPGDLAVLVVPVDQAAPKGRLILPQVMTLRDILDHDAIGVVVKERELSISMASLGRKPKLVITDSQAFLKVSADTPSDVWLTGFSILMARYRGDLAAFVEGAKALKRLRQGSRVLIAEGCTHHRQADDIGTVQIPRWLRQAVGGELHFSFTSGAEFPDDLASFDLVIHCGACTLTRREMLYRQREARAAGVPMTNYGITLAWVHGILERALLPFPLASLLWSEDSTTAAPRRLRLERTLS